MYLSCYCTKVICFSGALLCCFHITTQKHTEKFYWRKVSVTFCAFCFYCSDDFSLSFSLSRRNSKHIWKAKKKKTCAQYVVVLRLLQAEGCCIIYDEWRTVIERGRGRNREHALPHSSGQGAFGGGFRSASTEGTIVRGRWLWIFILSISLQVLALLLWPLHSWSYTALLIAGSFSKDNFRKSHLYLLPLEDLGYNVISTS